MCTPNTIPSYIQTMSGMEFNFSCPSPDSIQMEDIAHALSQTCRFGGHTKTFYSVADHSINVATQVAYARHNFATIFAALLHDAAEAYTGDIVTPLKRMLPGLRIMEIETMDAIHNRFSIDTRLVDFSAIKRADVSLLVAEAKSLFRTPPIHDWTDEFEADPLLQPMHISRSTTESQLLFRVVSEWLAMHDPARTMFG